MTEAVATNTKDALEAPSDMSNHEAVRDAATLQSHILKRELEQSVPAVLGSPDEVDRVLEPVGE